MQLMVQNPIRSFVTRAEYRGIVSTGRALEEEQMQLHTLPRLACLPLPHRPSGRVRRTKLAPDAFEIHARCDRYFPGLAAADLMAAAASWVNWPGGVVEEEEW